MKVRAFLYLSFNKYQGTKLLENHNPLSINVLYENCAQTAKRKKYKSKRRGRVDWIIY